MSEHTVTIEFDRHGFGASLKFACTAPVGAACRMVCERSECEEGCVDPDNHERPDWGACNVVTWLENGDDVETWILGDRTSVTAPIEYAWDGVYEGPEWRFATPPPSTTDREAERDGR